MKKNYYTSPFLILSLIFFAVFPLACEKKASSQSTGGLTRVRVENTVVEVEGGFVRGISKEEIFIRLQGLSAKIHIYPWEAGKEAAPERLQFHINNLYASRIALEGVEKYQFNDREISFQLDLNDKKAHRIKLQTRWTEPQFVFAVLGDSRDNQNIFKKILHKIEKDKPLFIAHNGDFVARGEQEEYENFYKIIQETKFPLFFALGNHDVTGWGKNLAQEYFGPTYYSFTFSDCHFIFLDNSSLRLDDAQYRWLSAQLEKNKHLRQFIFMHVPPFDPRENLHHAMDLKSNIQWFYDLIERYQVKAVFASHIHHYSESKKGETMFYITGGAGAPLVNNEAFFHYLLVTVSQDKFKTEVINVE